jgi:membrane protein DedA with SNARE-associated domain
MVAKTIAELTHFTDYVLRRVFNNHGIAILLLARRLAFAKSWLSFLFGTFKLELTR